MVSAIVAGTDIHTFCMEISSGMSVDRLLNHVLILSDRIYMHKSIFDSFSEIYSRFCIQESEPSVQVSKASRVLRIELALRFLLYILCIYIL